MPDSHPKGASSRVDLKSIEASLRSRIVGRSDRNELWDTIDSTSTRATALAEKGAPEGVFVIARQQSAGRGRQGKTWVSNIDSGIFISFILRPSLKPSLLPLVSFAAGLATAEAIEASCGIEAGIKWVNDLIFDGCKLGGILCEMAGSQALSASSSRESGNSTAQARTTPALIIGIGINLNINPDLLPDELRNRTASLDQICGNKINANNLVVELCHRLEWRYEQLQQDGAEAILDLWKQRSVTLGKEVKAISGSTEITGRAIDIAPNGALVVKEENGKETHLHAGEISLRLADGSYA